MNLNELRDRAYKTACDRGFHDEELSNEHCLCLVISELMEAVEADRKGKRANVDWYNKKMANSRICQGLVPGTPKEIGFEVAYNETIKGSIEEELADACIRLLDLCGLRKIDIEDFTEEMLYDAEESCNDETFTESVYAISTIPIRYEYEYDYPLGGQLNSMLLAIFGLAKHLDIDLIWHINQKMRDKVKSRTFLGWCMRVIEKVYLAMQTEPTILQTPSSLTSRYVPPTPGDLYSMQIIIPSQPLACDVQEELSSCIKLYQMYSHQWSTRLSDKEIPHGYIAVLERYHGGKLISRIGLKTQWLCHARIQIVSERIG